MKLYFIKEPLKTIPNLAKYSIPPCRARDTRLNGHKSIEVLSRQHLRLLSKTESLV